MLRLKGKAIVAFHVAAMFAASSVAQLTDQVYTSGGTPTRGQITNITPAEIDISVSNQIRKISVRDIRKINFSGEARELRKVRDLMADGRYEDVKEALVKVSVESLETRKALKADYDFFGAYAEARLVLRGGGDKNGAVRKLNAFIKEHPASYHYFSAVELIADMAVSMGNYKAASKFYGDLIKAPWNDYKLRATVLQGRSMLAEKKYEDAVKRFDMVMESQYDDPESLLQKKMAETGKAVCLAESGNHDEGIKLVETIIANNDPQLSGILFGHAYNALGRCYLKANKPKDALLAFLHVDLLFFTDSETHAESLYNLSKLWGDQNQADRALRARATLTQRYAGSVWAKEE